MVQGFSVASSIQLNSGISAVPATRSIALFLRKPPTTPRSLEMPAAPRLMLSELLRPSVSASVRTELLLMSSALSISQLKLDSVELGMSSRSIGAPSEPLSEKSSGVSPRGVGRWDASESRKLGASSSPPGVSICISISPPAGRSGRSPPRMLSVFAWVCTSTASSPPPW